MQTLTRPLAAALAALALAGPAAAQDTATQAAPAQDTAPQEVPGLDTVVASVNGQEITLGHMVAARASLPAQYQQLPDDVLFTALLDQLVQQALLAQTQDELTGLAELSLENERRLLAAAQAVEEIVGQAVTPEALQAAYDEQYGNAEAGTEYNASHILVETEEKARELIAELEGGADFAALAQEHSTGPSGPSGGALGWFGEGAMVAPFQEAVMAMEPGTVSDAPVQTQFGWHVIRLNETRQAEAPTLDEVRGELEEQVRQQAVQDRLEALRTEAEIDRSGADAMQPSALSAAAQAQE